LRINDETLRRWQQLDALSVLLVLADHGKADNTFRPTKSTMTSRWHATVRGVEFELLLTGPKFWDTRANRGGGGGVDLVMHLLGLQFKSAANLLVELGL
jgi:hypothetical protein